MQDYERENQFTADQIAEIQAGENYGLDVSVYANPELFAIQMREIRIGMMEQLPVRLYADSKYDWFQMEEIRKGLEQGVDVSLYADAFIPFDVMRQIRKGLKVGINLAPERHLESGVLRQWRKAILSGVDIVPYIRQGYDQRQLWQIRTALKKGLDIAPYLSLSLRGVSIREIQLGLDHKINVSVYAKEEYGWQQMREIRLGMEKRLDVSVYANPLYTWQQMYEIRLGMADGLDISYYANLMYTAKAMQIRRMELLERGQLSFAVSASQKWSHDDFDLIMSGDGMEAAICVHAIGHPINQKEVVQALKTAGIVKGVDYAALKSICDGSIGSDVIVVARGKHPQDGADGWYEFLVDGNIGKKQAVLPDGSVDYQSKTWFTFVKKGQKIAYYHSAKPGTPGYQITGETLPAKNGREKKILVGSGFQVLSDQKTYVADMDGRVERKGNNLAVSKVLALNSVTNKTGNIDFDGSVYVKGDIKQGTVIRAAKDILVDGTAEAAVLEAGGDIILRKGINADGKGQLKAGRNVMGMFLEATSVTAGENIRANSCLKCDLIAGNKIDIIGGTGVLYGGTVKAGRLIRARNIGNEAEIGTKLVVGNYAKFLQEEKEIMGKEKKAKQELKLLMNAYQDYRQKFKPEVRNVSSVYLKLESAIYTKQKELKKICRKRADLQREKTKGKSAKVVVTGTIFPGVCAEINGETWNANRQERVIIGQTDGRIEIEKMSEEAGQKG